jgi:hypothetical protein
MRDRRNPGERLRPYEPCTAPWRVYTPPPPRPGAPIFSLSWTPIGDRLGPGGRLNSGQQLRNGVYTLSMYPQGQLVLDRGGGNLIEAPLSAVVADSFAELRQGENFVNFMVCEPNGGMLWQSGPQGPGDLVLENDGRITIGGNTLV